MRKQTKQSSEAPAPVQEPKVLAEIIVRKLANGDVQFSHTGQPTPNILDGLALVKHAELVLERAHAGLPVK
jgi:hypothetical protein